MPTNITQLEDLERNLVVLRVEGEMNREDAELLKKISSQIRSETSKAVSLDLSDLNLMDSEAAPLIRKMEEDEGFLIEGIPYFVQNMVSESENQSG